MELRGGWGVLCVGVRLLTVATLRRKVRMLSVISGAAAHPSSADKGGAGGWRATSHGRKLLTIHLAWSTQEEELHDATARRVTKGGHLHALLTPKA